MTILRDKLAAQAQIGDVKFWATGASGPGGQRRVVQYTGVGVEGAFTEDLGSDARVEQLTAIVDEDTYTSLINLRDAGNVVTAVHPLFGVMQARLAIEYQAGPDEMVDVTITLTEHGEPTIFLPSQTVTLPGSAQNAKSAFDDLSDDLDGLADIPDLPDSLSSASDAFDTGWDAFDDALDDALGGDLTWEELGAEFDALARLGDDLIEQVDAAWSDFADLADYDVESGVLSVINQARGCVDAMENQVSEVWQQFKVVNPVSVAEVALSLVGDASDEIIDQILDRNPTLIDVNAIVTGVELSIPVIL